MNVVSVIGNLTKDPVLSKAGGKQVCRMRLGIQRGPGRAIFTDVHVFDGDARRCVARLSQGDAVAISGSLNMSEWVGRDGVRRSSLYILARSVFILGAPVREPVEPEEDPFAEGKAVEDEPVEA